MKFEDYSFCEELHRGLAELGFRKPTDIQYKTISPILKGEDVLAIAQTGTGKTAAFAIPIIELLEQRKHLRNRENHIYCLVLLPTRELALQIEAVFKQIAKYTHVSIGTLVGGVDQAPQIKKLEKGVDILISTPGRMFDLIYQKKVNINHVEIFVLDEADHMLDLGFHKDIQDVMKFIPKRHQTLFFSATINEKIKDLAYGVVQKAIRIQLSPKDPVSKNIDHSVAYVAMDDKRFFLERLLKEHPESKVLVFVRTQVRAERVCKAMERVGIHTETLHGGKIQDDRNQVMERFRTGENKVLIATDVSARGIDIPNVEYVFNYDLPEVSENYVHRVGRTGRGVNKGTAVSFCSEEEKQVLEQIQTFLGQPIKVIDLSTEDYVNIKGMSEEKNKDWKSLLSEQEAFEKKRKKPFKKK